MQAGATAVVPETLEPSLQLASAVLSQLNMPQDEVAHAIQAFRKSHISELQVCVWPCQNHVQALGENTDLCCTSNPHGSASIFLAPLYNFSCCVGIDVACFGSAWLSALRRYMCR